VTGNKYLDCGGNPNHNTHIGILTGIFIIAYKGNCLNFAITKFSTNSYKNNYLRGGMSC